MTQIQIAAACIRVASETPREGRIIVQRGLQEMLLKVPSLVSQSGNSEFSLFYK